MPDMLGEASQDAFDSAVRAKGERILASGRQNVTSLQARAGMMDERGARTYWRGLVRPIPNVASPAAQLGTQFHAWAERFIMADANDAGIGVGASGNGGTRVAESRLAMLAELRRNNAAQSPRPIKTIMGQTITGYSIGNSVSQRRHGHGASPRGRNGKSSSTCRNWAPSSTASSTRCSSGVSMGWIGRNNILLSIGKLEKTSQKRGNSEKISTVGYVSYLAVGNGGCTAYRCRRLPLLSE